MLRFSKLAKLKGKTIGFVPTMGALHQGHISLIRRARQENDFVAVSIFVNPAQFSAQEDLKKYPRDLKKDAKICMIEKVDVLFFPQAKAMYPAGYKTYVSVEDLSDCLCGRFRPGHFRGVTTVVAKLFHIVMPDIAYFGQKDAQQAVIIKKMAGDLNLPLKIKVLPTVREEGGLAMSSRNAYLNPGQKKDALVLKQALNLARNLVRGGEKNAVIIIRRMRQLIAKKKNIKIQYIDIVNSEDLKPQARVGNKTLIALAAYAGKTRLIDNICLNS